VRDQLDPGMATSNLLLDALDPEERGAVLEGADKRALEVGDVLVQPGDPMTVVAFPTRGTLSMVAQPDETRVEAATIGLEGVAGVHSALGSRTASQEIVGQIEGEMITIPVETFAKEARAEGRFQDLVYGYLEAMVVQISLTAACNAIHPLNQRCARWLLQSHDRVGSDTFGLTQEFLGVMLAVQRPSVSIAERTLQEAGCITFRRGSVTVLDREGLETAACPCYEQIRAEYSRLVPLQVRR
jgi:CRP-like cAMP-binding protein